MPLQNRVLPTGEIVADPARGLFTGNRGCLHDDQRQLRRARWKSKAWIICALQYKGWQRTLMTPRSWTELFFLDEAVALAAGHRPCALCRRDAFKAFARAFGGLSAPEIDAALHAARIGPARQQRRYQADPFSLPAGAFILHAGAAHLITASGLRRYPPSGYGATVPMPAGPVMVLTPEPTVAALAAGYTPVTAITTGPDDRSPGPGRFAVRQA